MSGASGWGSPARKPWMAPCMLRRGYRRTSAIPIQSCANPNNPQIITDPVVQLLDLIGQAVVLMVNSGVASSGWVVADARPKLVKGILAAEPVAPPIENAERGATGPGRLWGVTSLPIHYDPPVKDPSELRPVREEKADGPDLIPCWVQQEPAHK